MISVTKKRLVSALVLLIAATALLTIRTNHIFSLLLPTEGAAHGLTLTSTAAPTYHFVSTMKNLACVGLFLTPLRQNIPTDVVSINILHRETVIGRGQIPTSFIDSQGAARVCFDPPLVIPRGEPMTLALSIPDSLDNSLRLARNLTANQEHLIAHELSYRGPPPLALQLSGLLMLGALTIVRPPRPFVLAIYLLASPFIFLIPAYLVGQFPLAIFLWAVLALAGTFIFLQTFQLGWLPTLFGAHLLAYTTWFPLHAAAGREKYLVLALLPAIAASFSLLRHSRPHHRALYLIGGLVIVAAVLALAPWTPIERFPDVVAHPRDAFFDPNQVVDTDKFGNEAASWDHFGSYVGIIPTMLAGIGLVTRVHRHWKVALLGLVGLLVALTPAVTLQLVHVLPLPPQYFIIFTTFALSFFAALGLKVLQDYLNKYTLAPIIIFLITYLALLDLWQVAGKTLGAHPLPYGS